MEAVKKFLKQSREKIRNKINTNKGFILDLVAFFMDRWRQRDIVFV